MDLICVGAWAIWNDRNQVVHNLPISSIEDHCAWIHEYLAEFRKANGIRESHPLTEETYHELIQNGEDIIMHTDVSLDTLN